MASFQRTVKRQKNEIKEKELLAKTYQRGFSDGTKAQLEHDIQAMTAILTRLENAEGIGEKTATRVREFFLDELGKVSD
jgi:ERCC4-type nuclease